MKIYHCQYQYSKQGRVFSEDNYILANGENECKDLLEQVLGTRLTYFTYTIPISFVSAISKEIVDYISMSNYNRISQKRELAKMTANQYNYPDNEMMNKIETMKTATEPKPLINKVKDKLLQKYQ
ncbi:MAG: hypothetical protein KQH59_01925 [Desulfobulbaceae bacterium]|nr:hypothetical protein [Desulfobulbaceae bacterium]